MLPIFMGWDGREEAAYRVAEASILRRTQADVRIVPLKLREPPVSGLLARPIEQRDGRMWCPISEAPMATEFAISRFCVPFIQRAGWALFVDCDVLCLADIAELFALADDKYAVMVVKHQQAVTAGETKMDDQAQTGYQRKNWSSVCLWNCSHPAHERLTLGKLNAWAGRTLHSFLWLKDREIGELPATWNFLVGVDALGIGGGMEVGWTPAGNLASGAAVQVLREEEIKLAHFTLGGPWLSDWKGGPLDGLWTKEAESCALTVNPGV